MLSTVAAHKDSCDANGFADFCDLLIELALIIGYLGLLLFQTIDGREKLRPLVFCMRGPYDRSTDGKQTDQADKMLLHCARPA
jgi:hypothetical protein